MSDLWTFWVTASAEGCLSACTVFLKMLAKFNMAATDQHHIFVAQLRKSPKSVTFWNPILHKMEMSRFYWNVKWHPRISTNIFSGRKKCGWFLQGFTEIQNGRHKSTLFFLWAQKHNLKSEIMKNLHLPSPQYKNAQVIFSGALPKFKMAATTFQLFVGTTTKNVFMAGDDIYRTSSLSLICFIV